MHNRELDEEQAAELLEALRAVLDEGRSDILYFLDSYDPDYAEHFLFDRTGSTVPADHVAM